jgi:hypothetical protein
MRKTLIRMLGMAAFCFLYSQVVYSQPVVVRDNKNQQIQAVDIFFKRPGDTTWRPALPAPTRLFISEHAIRMRFSIHVVSLSPSPTKLRARVELRRRCPTPSGGSGLNSRVTEYFTSTEPLEGSDINLVADRLEIEIPLAPCATGCIPNNASGLVCRHPDTDHLGEGPYQAIVTLGPEAGSLQSPDTPRLVYNRDFNTRDDSFFPAPGASERSTRKRAKPRRRN